jgi:hypothetical protein
MTPSNIIIMPEMANAVICPDTGKSMKHNELITKLRYRIKWMRSTANEINRLYKSAVPLYLTVICRAPSFIELLFY